MQRCGVRLFPPTPFEVLQRLDRVGVVVVHSLEDDDSIPGDFDAVLPDLKTIRFREAKLSDFVLDQELGGLGEILLELPKAHGTHALAAFSGFSQTILDQQFTEEMRFPP